jgi:clathrin heavy chain
MMSSCAYIQNNDQMAFNLAKLNGLAGADGAFQDMFNNALGRGDYMAAAGIVADSPGDTLRNQTTLDQFKGLQQQAGQPQPILIYFQTLIKRTRLLDYESVELCKLVLG